MELTGLQHLIIGIIQGILEWLPISSSGINALILTNWFGITDLSTLFRHLLFLHLGTFLAALIYFWKDVTRLTKSLFTYKKAKTQDKKTIWFIIIATIISGIIGLLFVKFLLDSNLELTGKAITLLIGVFLLITGLIQIKKIKFGIKREKDLKTRDGVLLGLAQGLSILPGISRSGITVSTLLAKRFDDTTALRLSFLLSLPIVLVGNIFLNFKDFLFTSQALWGLVAAFVLGLLTIHGLMKLSRKINFAWFVIIFAILMLLSLLI